MTNEHDDAPVIRTTQEGGVVTAIIDAPPLNLVGGPFMAALLARLAEWEADAGVRVVVFASADPDYFLMHGDVELLAGLVPADTTVTAPNLAAATFERLRRSSFVTIGVLDGIARGGGCEFLSALDIRLGSARAVIGQPEVAMGILPGAGGTARWPRLIGRAAALELLLTGRDMDAAEALGCGWLQRVVPSAALMDTADALARRIASMPVASVSAIKEVVDASLGAPTDALTAESAALSRLMSGRAHVEPMRRFLAAGGQTRDGERGDIGALLDVMTASDERE